MNKQAENATLVVGAILIFFTGLICGTITAERALTKQSLKGYEAIATYKTNDVGEVSIVSVKWQPILRRKYETP